jgi:hypothetical protein
LNGLILTSSLHLTCLPKTIKVCIALLHRYMYM